MTELILERIESNSLIDQQDKIGETPLHLAFYRMSREIIEMLLQKNAKLDIKNRSGKRPTDLINLKDPKMAVEMLEELIEKNSGRFSAVNLEIIHEKIVEVNELLEGNQMKDKWKDDTLNVALNDKNVRDFKRRFFSKREQQKVQLLTVEDKLEHSLENVLQYSQETELDYQNISFGENENEEAFEQFRDFSDEKLDQKNQVGL